MSDAKFLPIACRVFGHAWFFKTMITYKCDVRDKPSVKAPKITLQVYEKPYAGGILIPGSAHVIKHFCSDECFLTFARDEIRDSKMTTEQLEYARVIADKIRDLPKQTIGEFVKEWRKRQICEASDECFNLATHVAEQSIDQGVTRTMAKICATCAEHWNNGSDWNALVVRIKKE